MNALIALLRLAWRDTRRSPRRLALLVALIALPTAAAVAASVLVRAATDTPEETVSHDMGGANALVTRGTVDGGGRVINPLAGPRSLVDDSPARFASCR